jgi:hypothetical protein
MVLIAAMALTLAISPALMHGIMRAYGPTSSWNQRMYVDGVTSITLTCWALILAPLALVGNAQGLSHASRSYGISAVLAAALATCVLFAGEALNAFVGIKSAGMAMSEVGLEFVLQKLWVSLEDMPRVTAAAIIAVWAILGMSRTGRRPSSWFEVLASLFGLLCVAWLFIRPMSYLIDLAWLSGDALVW